MISLKKWRELKMVSSLFLGQKLVDLEHEKLNETNIEDIKASKSEIDEKNKTD